VVRSASASHKEGQGVEEREDRERERKSKGERKSEWGAQERENKGGCCPPSGPRAQHPGWGCSARPPTMRRRRAAPAAGRRGRGGCPLKWITGGGLAPLQQRNQGGFAPLQQRERGFAPLSGHAQGPRWAPGCPRPPAGRRRRRTQGWLRPPQRERGERGELVWGFFYGGDGFGGDLKRWWRNWG